MMQSTGPSPEQGNGSRAQTLEAEIWALEQLLRVGSLEELSTALRILRGLGLKMEDREQSVDAHVEILLAALRNIPISAVRSAISAIARGETDIMTFYPSVPKIIALCGRFEMSDRRRLDQMKRELRQLRSLPPPPPSPEEDNRRDAHVQERLTRLGLACGDLRRSHWLEKLPDLPGAEVMPDAPDQIRRLGESLGKVWFRPGGKPHLRQPEAEAPVEPSRELLKVLGRQNAEHRRRANGGQDA